MKNPSIGTCPCPFANCREICRVAKFKASHQRDLARRLAGKLYLDCPKHGRIGMDAKPELQEWILEHATIAPGAVEVPEVPQVPAAPPPAPAPRAEEKPKPAAAPAAPKKSGWGFFDA